MGIHLGEELVISLPLLLSLSLSLCPIVWSKFKALVSLDPYLPPYNLPSPSFALIDNLKKSTKETQEGGGGAVGVGGKQVMEASLSPAMNEDADEELKPQAPPAKKRWIAIPSCMHRNSVKAVELLARCMGSYRPI